MDTGAQVEVSYKEFIEIQTEDMVNVFERTFLDDNDFNKFKFVHDVLDQTISYDYILMKDSDIDLSGFEPVVIREGKGNLDVI